MARNVIPLNSAKNIVELEIPIAGRDEPICASVPLLKWMPPRHVKAYDKWAKDLLKLEEKFIEWSTADEETRGEAPCSEDDIPTDPHRVMILRWLEPFVSEKDYAAIMDEVPKAGADWILALLTDKDPEAEDSDVDGDAEISVGESEASALS